MSQFPSAWTRPSQVTRQMDSSIRETPSKSQENPNGHTYSPWPKSPVQTRDTPSYTPHRGFQPYSDESAKTRNRSDIHEPPWNTNYDTRTSENPTRSHESFLQPSNSGQNRTFNYSSTGIAPPVPPRPHPYSNIQGTPYPTSTHRDYSRNTYGSLAPPPSTSPRIPPRPSKINLNLDGNTHIASLPAPWNMSDMMPNPKAYIQPNRTNFKPELNSNSNGFNQPYRRGNAPPLPPKIQLDTYTPSPTSSEIPSFGGNLGESPAPSIGDLRTALELKEKQGPGRGYRTEPYPRPSVHSNPSTTSSTPGGLLDQDPNFNSNASLGPNTISSNLSEKLRGLRTVRGEIPKGFIMTYTGRERGTISKWIKPNTKSGSKDSTRVEFKLNPDHPEYKESFWFNPTHSKLNLDENTLRQCYSSKIERSFNNYISDVSYRGYKLFDIYNQKFQQYSAADQSGKKGKTVERDKQALQQTSQDIFLFDRNTAEEFKDFVNVDYDYASWKAWTRDLESLDEPLLSADWRRAANEEAQVYLDGRYQIYRRSQIPVELE